MSSRRSSRRLLPPVSLKGIRGLLGIGLLCFSTVTSGQEGNYKFENFGNQSVLLNGNVTGSVEDLGLVYHNPARLGLIENPSFTFGGKAFEWSRYYFDGVLETDNNLNANQFTGVPATLAGTFSIKALPGHKFALSVISRLRSDIRLRYSSGLVPPDDTDLDLPVSQQLAELRFRDKLKDDWYGITWAYPITESFSVGMSVFVSAYLNDGRGDILINEEVETGQVVTYTKRVDYRQRTYGGQIRIGAAWEVADLEMGVNMGLPFISVYRSANLNYQESLAGFSGDADFIIRENYGDLENRRKTAFSLSYGVGIPWKKHKIHVNLDWNGAVGSYERIEIPEEALGFLGENPFRETLNSVVNFGAGGEFYISPSITIIGSFSSDFSAAEESINLFDYINQSTDDINLLDDIWHGAVGIDLHRPWGNIIVGTSYARSGSKVLTTPTIPENGQEVPPRNISSQINYERWRFIVGVEIPLLMEKLKKIPEKFE